MGWLDRDVDDLEEEGAVVDEAAHADYFFRGVGGSGGSGRLLDDHYAVPGAGEGGWDGGEGWWGQAGVLAEVVVLLGGGGAF